MAYEFVIPSYQWLLQRLTAIEGRIQTLLGFAATITVAAPIFASAFVPGIELESIWFILAVVAFAGVLVVGVVALGWGYLELVSPSQLYEKWLHYEPEDFKRNMVHFAGKDFGHNRRLVNVKAWAAILMSCLLLVEVVFLVVWVLAEN